MNSPLWVIATPPRFISDLLAIKSPMFEVVLANNYVMFCKSTTMSCFASQTNHERTYNHEKTHVVIVF
jgi:hypothetical protein